MNQRVAIKIVLYKFLQDGLSTDDAVNQIYDLFECKSCGEKTSFTEPTKCTNIDCNNNVLLAKFLFQFPQFFTKMNY